MWCRCMIPIWPVNGVFPIINNFLPKQVYMMTAGLMLLARKKPIITNYQFRFSKIWSKISSVLLGFDIVAIQKQVYTFSFFTELN